MATGMSTLAATFSSAFRFSGGQGSSSHAGLKGARSLARRMAVAGEKRPCISSISSASGPMASRTASIRETAYMLCSWSSSKWPVPKGSILSAL